MEEGCLTFIVAYGETEGRAEEWALSLAMNNDPLRSSISIIITISFLGNCVHFAGTVLHMHEGSICGSVVQDLNTPGWLKKAQEGGPVWSGITEKASISWNTRNMADFSQQSPVIKGLATVGRPEYTPFSVWRIASPFFNFMCHHAWRGARGGEWRWRHMQLHSVHPESSKMWNKSTYSGDTGVMT